MRRVWIAAAVFVGVLSGLAMYRWHIWSYGPDLGIFAQIVLNATSGFRDGPENGSHFLYHFSPILAVLYPFIAWTKTPLVLQIVQAGLIAMSAPALYAVFRPYLREALSVRLAILALMYPPLAAVAFNEFHETAFFPALAIGLMWAADRCKWAWFAIFGLGCLMTREDTALVIAMVSLCLALFALFRRAADQRGLLAGAPQQPMQTALAFGSLSLAAVAVVAGYYHVVMATHGWHPSYFYYYSFAKGPTAVLLALVLHPWIAWPALITFGRFTYILEAIVPLALLPLRSLWSALALPGFAIVLLAKSDIIWHMGYQYPALWAPWLLIGAGAALLRMEHARGERLALGWSNAALVACAVFLVAINPMHLRHYLTPPYRDLAAAKAALACVPRGASVSTHEDWFPHIALQYPNSTDWRSDTEYLVYANDFDPQVQALLLPGILKDVKAGRYLVVCTINRVTTYRRNT